LVDECTNKKNDRIRWLALSTAVAILDLAFESDVPYPWCVLAHGLELECRDGDLELADGDTSSTADIESTTASSATEQRRAAGRVRERTVVPASPQSGFDSGDKRRHHASIDRIAVVCGEFCGCDAGSADPDELDVGTRSPGRVV
jgi:hypothetical protein